MLGIPPVLAIFICVAALVWVVNVATWLNRWTVSPAKMLSCNVWGVVLMGCALTVVRRLELGSVATLLLTLGTFAILFVFLTAALAGAPKDAPNRTMAALAVWIAGGEFLYLMIHPDGASENVPEVLAVAFLPGIVIQIRNSKGSREYLLRLAAQVSAFVVWFSVILGFAVPALAFGEGYSDQRRWAVLGMTMRLSGLTPHPNYLSVTALMCLVLVVALKLRWWRTTALVCLIALGMAESRNAILTLVVVLGVAWICNGKSIILRALVFSPICLAASLFSGWLEGSTLTADIETNGRYRIWDTVLALFQENPINGWGPLAFQSESGSPMLPSGLQHAHNQILQSIAEGGALGGFLAVMMLLVLLKIAIKHRYEVVYPSIAVVFMMGIFTEPFLTLHLYGLNYAVVPAFLMFIVMMSADASRESVTPVVAQERRRDLPDYFNRTDSETRRLLGLSNEKPQEVEQVHTRPLGKE